MGVRTRAGEWLGVSRQRPVAGVTFGQGHVVVAALRPNPIRLVGIARRAVHDGVVVDGDVRRPQQLAATLAEMRSALNLDNGTSCVVSIDPLERSIHVSGWTDAVVATQASTLLGSSVEPEIEVGRSNFDRAGFVAAMAGFQPDRIDVRPAALARVALAEHGDNAAVRTTDGWSIVAADDMLDASKRLPTSVQCLQTGDDLNSTTVRTALTSVSVPNRLRPVLDLDHHGEAVGAALASFGMAPLITPAPTSPPQFVADQVDQRAAESVSVAGV